MILDFELRERERERGREREIIIFIKQYEDSVMNSTIREDMLVKSRMDKVKLYNFVKICKDSSGLTSDFVCQYDNSHTVK